MYFRISLINFECISRHLRGVKIKLFRGNIPPNPLVDSSLLVYLSSRPPPPPPLHSKTCCAGPEFKRTCSFCRFSYFTNKSEFLRQVTPPEQISTELKHWVRLSNDCFVHLITESVTCCVELNILRKTEAYS